MIVLARGARDLLLAARCAGCGTGGTWFCVRCVDDCDRTTLRVSSTLTVSGAGTYEGGLRDAVHALKYRDERALARELGAMVAALVAQDAATGTLADVVVPVPLHRARAAERGYDQAALLAAAVVRATGIPLRDALHRIAPTKPQVGLDRAARAANVRGAFVAGHGSLRGLRVALIDDVTTTGATIAAAAAAARAAGARSAHGYVVGIDA